MGPGQTTPTALKIGCCCKQHGCHSPVAVGEGAVLAVIQASFQVAAPPNCHCWSRCGIGMLLHARDGHHCEFPASSCQTATSTSIALSLLVNNHVVLHQMQVQFPCSDSGRQADCQPAPTPAGGLHRACSSPWRRAQPTNTALPPRVILYRRSMTRPWGMTTSR